MQVKTPSSKIDNFKRILKAFKVDHDEVHLSELELFDYYDVALSPGTRHIKLQRILPDIALNLKAKSIPRGYLVPEEGIYRVEVQKKNLVTKRFKEVGFNPNNYYAPVVLGTDTDSSPLIIDLPKIPNLLIGGIPGAGKSSLLHSVILSLMHVNAELYLADPKMVEFQVYSGLKTTSYYADSIEGFAHIIESVTHKMNERYKLLSRFRSKNVLEYNKSVRASKKIKPIVIVVDEWADIVLQNKNLQNPLCTIAQKGRAAGIFIVLATQRPSRSVISGLIKASFPGRISMRVASAVDSRIILDQAGGERIVNVGEGLYLAPNSGVPSLFKAPHISNPMDIIKYSNELRNAIPFWKRIWL